MWKNCTDVGRNGKHMPIRILTSVEGGGRGDVRVLNCIFTHFFSWLERV